MTVTQPEMVYTPAEQVRLRNNTERVKALMQDGQWHDALEICRVGGARGVGRLFDLKADGWAYDKRKQSAGVWEYRLYRPAPMMERLF